MGTLLEKVGSWAALGHFEEVHIRSIAETMPDDIQIWQRAFYRTSLRWTEGSSIAGQPKPIEGVPNLIDLLRVPF